MLLKKLNNGLSSLQVVKCSRSLRQGSSDDGLFEL